MKNLLILLAFLSFSLSCTEKEGKEMSQLSVNDSSKYFEESFGLCSIVPIETSDSLLLADIDRLVNVNGNYLILSKKVGIVALIDGESGKAKTIINRLGNGPGESRTIIDVTYDEANGHILIYNDYSKLLFFDLDGNYLREQRVPGTFENIAYRQGKVWFYSELNGYSCFPYYLKALDLAMNEWFEVGVETELKFPIRSKGLQMVCSKQLYFNAPIDYRIYNVTDDDYKPLYDIGFPNIKFAKRLCELSVANPMDFMNKVYEEKITYSINSIRELNNNFVFRTNLMELCFLDKRQECVNKEKMILWDFFNITPNDYFPHDGDDNRILFVLSADRWIEGLRTLGDLPASYENMISGIDVEEGDNPVLVFFEELPRMD